MAELGFGRVDYEYDTLSQLTSETRAFDGVTGAFRLEYGYDVGGRLTSLKNPWGITVGYARDKAGRVGVVTNTGYGGFGNYTDDIRYRASGAVKSKALGNGRAFTAQYDNRLRLKRWDVAGVAGAEYRYDNFGENTGRVTYAKNIYDGSLDRSYQYDQVGRLVYSLTGGEARHHALGEASPAQPDGDYGHGLAHDERGNITLRTGWGGTSAMGAATYNARNQRDGQSHDAAGNMTSDGYTSFAYDATGSEASATTPGVHNVTHTYDGDSMRVKRVENGQTTLYLRSSVMGGAIIAEMNSAGGWTRGYVYGESGNLTAIQQPEGYVEWVTQDPVTKGQRITNAQGAVTASLEFDPFGGETSKSSNSYRQPQKYTTYTRDGNQTDDAMHRRYSAFWSRFQQPDPYDGSYDLTDPQSFNRYAYVGNDPVNFTDPSGLFGMEVPMAYGSPTFDWGGGDGGMYAFWGSRIADLPGFGTNWGSFAALAEMGYEERLNNARSGYGFISNEQVARQINQLCVGDRCWDDGMGSVTVTASLSGWERANDRTSNFVYGLTNAVSLGLVDWAIDFDRRHGLGEHNEINPNSGDAQAGAMMAVVVPGPGGKLGAAKSLMSAFGKGTFPTIAKSLRYHFGKHGAEVGAKDAWQYMRKAEAFGRNLRGARTSDLGDGITRYTKNGYYIIKDAAGGILSYGRAR